MRPAQAERDLATSVRPDSISAGISEVEFYAGELWMLTDGKLLAANLDSGRVERRLAREPVLDVFRTTDDRFWALSMAPDTEDVHVWQRSAGAWEPLLEMSAPGSPLLALTEMRGAPLVLAERAVFWVEGETLRSTALDEPVRPGSRKWCSCFGDCRQIVTRVHVASTAAGSVYVGTNDDNLRCALRHVSAATGRVNTLVQADGQAPCTGLVRDATARDCALVSVGRRLWRACGLRVAAVAGPWEHADPLVFWESTDLVEAFAPPPFDLEERLAETKGLAEICEIDPAACPKLDLSKEAARCAYRPVVDYDTSAAILSLSLDKRGVWITTRGALYHRGPRGTQRLEVPEYEGFGGMAVARLPGALAIAPDVSRFLADEFTPLVAPTDAALRPTSAARSEESLFGSCFGIEVMSARLCIERDRYFWRDGLGWTSARLTSESLPDGTARLTLATGKELRFRLLQTVARVLTRDSRSLRVATIERIGGAELSALQREIAELPPVEHTCELARSCEHAVGNLEELARPHVPPRESDDLRNCLRSMQRNLEGLRLLARARQDDQRLSAAIAACGAR
jgi:hypothetical protein